VAKKLVIVESPAKAKTINKYLGKDYRVEASMGHVIVESPAKAKTINKYLGKDYHVEASMGHVRDLPKKELGVEVDGGFKPHYVPAHGKKKIISALKKCAENAEIVYLAPDFDREGEAIG